MRITQTSRKKRPIILFIIIGVLLIAAAYLSIAYATKSTWPFKTTPEVVDESKEDSINYAPPTDTELETSQDGKKDSTKENSTTNSSGENSTDKRTISVGVAFAGYDDAEGVIDIRAFTPDTIESDGKCTATLTLGTKTITQSSDAFIDSSSSQCKPILIPTNKFPVKGDWSLTVSYSSSKSAGVSAPVIVEVSK